MQPLCCCVLHVLLRGAVPVWKSLAPSPAQLAVSPVVLQRAGTLGAIQSLPSKTQDAPLGSASALALLKLQMELSTTLFLVQ